MFLIFGWLLLLVLPTTDICGFSVTFIKLRDIRRQIMSNFYFFMKTFHRPYWKYGYWFCGSTYFFKERFLENVFMYPNVFKNIVLLTTLILSWPEWIHLQIQKVQNFHHFMAEFDKFCYILQFFMFFPALNLWHVIYCR